MKQSQIQSRDLWQLSLLLLIISVITIARVWPLVPRLYPDEFFYGEAIRWNLFYDLPNFFYFFTYKPIALCGGDFYQCGKILNVVVFCILLVLTYLLSRRFLSHRGSMFYVVFIGLGPMSGYTSLLTPEILFFTLCLLVLVILGYLENRQSLSIWALIGIVTGLGILTKPQGLFLLAAILVLIAYQGFTSKRFLRTFFYLCTVTLSAYAIGILIRLLVLQELEFNPIGGRYSSAVNNLSYGLQQGQQILSPELYEFSNLFQVFVNQIGFHVFGILVITGLGLICIPTLLQQKVRLTGSEIFIIITTTVFLLGTVLFSVFSVYWGENLQERVTYRYYELFIYLLPLIFLKYLNKPNRVQLSIFVPLLILVFIYIREDSILMFAFDSYFIGLWKYAGLSLALLIIPVILLQLFLYNKKVKIKNLFIAQLVSVFLLSNAVFLVQSASALSTPLPIATESRALQEYLDQEKASNIAIVFTDANVYNRIKFWQSIENVTTINQESVSDSELSALLLTHDFVIVCYPIEVESNQNLIGGGEYFKLFSSNAER